MDRVAEIRRRLQTAFAPDLVEIIDESHKHAGHAGARGGGGHFLVTIVAGSFAGNAPIARHRMVYQAVSDMMPGEIHALSINAMTPQEYAARPDA